MKSKQRSAALRARRSMSADEREAASEKICDTLVHSHEFFAASAIACYLPMADEVDPRRIIERAWCAKKRIFCPVIGKRREMSFRELQADTCLLRNSYGLWEPFGSRAIPARQLDLVITPLVAFDGDNNRIGMGGGYFDRCFSWQRSINHWYRPKLIGVAYDCQKVEKIAPNPWDIRLYSVITESS